MRAVCVWLLVASCILAVSGDKKKIFTAIEAQTTVTLAWQKFDKFLVGNSNRGEGGLLLDCKDEEGTFECTVLKDFRLPEFLTSDMEALFKSEAEKRNQSPGQVQKTLSHGLLRLSIPGQKSNFAIVMKVEPAVVINNEDLEVISGGIIGRYLGYLKLPSDSRPEAVKPSLFEIHDTQVKVTYSIIEKDSKKTFKALIPFPICLHQNNVPFSKFVFQGKVVYDFGLGSEVANFNVERTSEHHAVLTVTWTYPLFRDSIPMEVDFDVVLARDTPAPLDKHLSPFDMQMCVRAGLKSFRKYLTSGKLDNPPSVRTSIGVVTLKLEAEPKLFRVIVPDDYHLLPSQMTETYSLFTTTVREDKHSGVSLRDLPGDVKRSVMRLENGNQAFEVIFRTAHPLAVAIPDEETPLVRLLMNLLAQ